MLSVAPHVEKTHSTRRDLQGEVYRCLDVKLRLHILGSYVNCLLCKVLPQGRESVRSTRQHRGMRTMSTGLYDNPILKTLNKAQCRAVCSNAATVAILAGPGSGKTHTLTSRVVWLVDTVGYLPENVIVATFTVKAAREMKERIGKALGHDRANKLILGTFHSIARRYLAAYGKKIGLNQKFGIADDSDSRAIIGRICKRLQLAVDPVIARGWISKKKAKGLEGDKPTKRQGSNQGPSSKDLETCYQEYQSHLEKSNLLDYDDLLVRCVDLLQQFPSCVSNVQTVLIDEYQDTNGVQYDLMKLFAQKQKSITVVGDPDQSIYGWRSAEIRNLYRLLHDYPGTEEVSLEENYRSSQSILDTSLQVIQQDTKRYQKVLLPVHNRGTRPVLRKLRSSSAEGEWIVSEVRRLSSMSGKMLGYDDVAILLRSAALSRHIESALGKAGIAYKMVGGFKFYERAEIKIILEYLRVIHQPENNDALARIINVPKRGVGDVTIKALLEEAERSKLSMWNLLIKHCRGDRSAKTNITKQAEQKISGELIRLIMGTRKRLENQEDGKPFGLVEMIEHLLTQLKFQKFLEDSHSEDHEQRWANVQEFLALASDFMKELEQGPDEALPEIDGLEQVKETDALARFLANVSLASDAQTNNQDQEAKPMVTISTIHAAKGLEWPIVFVPAAYNGSIPHMRSEDGDEERRLLYVAMTRAKALLYLSCPLYSSQNSGEKLELSPFLTPIASSFAKKGPSIERTKLNDIAGILRRKAPSDESIYKDLPSMASLEDDLYPVDPESTYQQNGRNDMRSGAEQFGDRSRSKRPRLHVPSAGTNENEDAPWRKDYGTTMEQASTFTVASLPGFMSAGAHQVAISAAVDAAESATRDDKKGTRKTINKRPADQGTLTGFVQRDTKSQSMAQPAKALNRNSGLDNRGLNGFAGKGAHGSAIKEKSAIDPALSNRKLGSGKLLTRPPQSRRDDTASTTTKQYAQFSSSPPRPVRPDVNPAAQDPVTEDVEPAPEPTRTAACLHSTTVTMPNGFGGFKRPAGLRRDGIAPIDRLRKPFKPLTINRS